MALPRDARLFWLRWQYRPKHRLVPPLHVLEDSPRNVKHYYSWYRRRDGGGRSYSWVKNKLQEAGLVAKAPGRGKHRKRRQRSPLEGMMLFQDGSRHQWVPGKLWDLILTMDDATSEQYSLFFVEEEGTGSSFERVALLMEQVRMRVGAWAATGFLP